VRTIIGVMGGARANARTLETARRLGRLVAERSWVLLNGGRAEGVMDASARGAAEAGGLVVGILPDSDTSRASSYLDIPVVTGIGDARNAVNVLSSDVVIALPGGAGTLSEIALALKAGKHVIVLDWALGPAFAPYHECGLLLGADTPEHAIALAERLLDSQGAAVS
jgi:uncharacterized protein (TIGR00725 family)